MIVTQKLANSTIKTWYKVKLKDKSRWSGLHHYCQNFKAMYVECFVLFLSNVATRAPLEIYFIMVYIVRICKKNVYRITYPLFFLIKKREKIEDWQGKGIQKWEMFIRMNCNKISNYFNISRNTVFSVANETFFSKRNNNNKYFWHAAK